MIRFEISNPTDAQRRLMQEIANDLDLHYSQFGNGKESKWKIARLDRLDQIAPQ